ncbi:MAG: hypothetical protein MK108_05175 [Mariniblastus sp.]|nr:hypothetical protein [Mariniblastus sp.]
MGLRQSTFKIAVTITLVIAAQLVSSQTGWSYQLTENSSSSSVTSLSQTSGPKVAEVVVTGNKELPMYALNRNISTRAGRFFDADLLQHDVDRLWRMPEVKRVNGPYVKETPDGLVITIDIVERQLIRSIQIIGNRGLSDRELRKKTNLTEGAPLDLNAVRMAKTRIEDHYQQKGYPRTQVEVMQDENIELGDVVFLIHEDQQQKIWDVKFEGNSFASDARLKTMIQSKPGILKVVGGLAKRNEIDQDVVRLANYYKSFGYFNCRIGRELEESNDGRWMTVRFIIDEGPRYKIRNVSFLGQNAYSHEQLSKLVDLKPDDKAMPEFNASKMNEDVVSLRELYGSEGFVFANVEAEPRFLEEPGMLDLVYKIEEGERYRVGQINVHIEGGGYTKREVVINRLSLKPGDWIDSNKITACERRLGAAQIFAGRQDPGGAAAPKIVVRTPELKQLEEGQRTAGAVSNSGNRIR